MCAIAFSKAVRNLMCGIIWGLVDISMSRADFGVIALLKHGTAVRRRGRTRGLKLRQTE